MQFLLDVAALALSATIAYIILSHVTSKKQNRGRPLPSPPGLPILGNAFSMTPSLLLSFLREKTKELGSIYELNVLSHRMVVVSDPKLVKEIMSQRPKVFRRTGNGEDELKLNGRPSHSLFNAEGEEWSRLRRLMAPAFSSRNVDLKTDDLVNEAFKLVARLRKYENTKEAVDMEPEAQSLTVRVISQVAIGGEKAPETEYFYGKQFAQDLQNIFRLRVERMLYPYPKFMWRFSPQYKLECIAVEAQRRFNERCAKLIEGRRKLLAVQGDGEKETGTMLDTLIRHNDDDQSTAPITDAELLDNVKVLYVAGSETTSIAICWALFHLSLNPQMLAAVREETDKLVSNDAQSLRSMVNVSNTLKYTHAVMKEVLRLGSPVSILTAQPVSGTEPVTLSNGVVLQPNDHVMFDFDSCLRDENVYKNGSKFDPDRWMTTDEVTLAEMEMNFFTFGAGRRICPGMGLAYSEAAIAVAVLVHHFDFVLACPPEAVKRVLRLTTKCEALPMYIKTRAK